MVVTFLPYLLSPILTVASDQPITCKQRGIADALHFPTKGGATDDTAWSLKKDAQRMAAAEGIALIPSNNVTGFRYVSFDARTSSAKKPYHAHMARDTGTTRQFDLGSFTTAAEAALAVARHIGWKSCSEAAKKQRRQCVIVAKEMMP